MPRPASVDSKNQLEGDGDEMLIIYNVLDLKANGLLRGKFSSSTGQMTHTEVKTKTQTEVPEIKVSYCPNCGTAKSKESAVYCSYCGSKL